jgi:acyl-CoA synthetase (AMP-forming)/AMP-acid ligase II
VDGHGYLRVVERLKDMMLVGGENVYSAEVEGCLAAHPAVKQAAVFGLPNVTLGQLVSSRGYTFN